MNTKKIGRWSSAIGHSATISRKRSGRGTISEIEEEEGSNRGRVTALIAQFGVLGISSQIRRSSCQVNAGVLAG